MAIELQHAARGAKPLSHRDRRRNGMAALRPLDNEAMRRLFERIIDEARRLERIADEEAEREAQPGDSLT